MSLERKIKQRTKRRELRVKSHLNKSVPRIAVFRSSKYIYAQLIDDAQQKTLASCSSLELKDLKGDKKEVAKLVGQELAKRVVKAGVESVCFDRGHYLYHGRVKALAEGLREGGLKF